MILDAEGIQRAITRMAHEILERNRDPASIAVVGIVAGGEPIAAMLCERLKEIAGAEILLGSLDVTLYRDDVFEGMAVPEVRPTVLPFDVRGRDIVLVDDVLYTGRTVRAALDALMDWGRPRCIRLAVLVDRGHRELPLHADYVGFIVSTELGESIEVRLAEIDGDDEVRHWSHAEVKA